MMTLPKLSYVLLSHNREKYIRGAIESAFAQDYEGELEYIFSDDCSTDSTYAIMQECVASYRGNRRVVLTQTPTNLHLAGNTNHALTFVTSDWIVRADDDDYSSIDRCSIIGDALIKHPECRYIVHGQIRFTDENDLAIKQLSMKQAASDKSTINILDSRNGYKVVSGHRPQFQSYKVWHMDVYRIFGNLELDGYYVDDLCSYYRANILGCGLSINHAAAYFMRDGSNNMSRGGDDGSRGFKSIMRLEQFHDKYYNITLRPLSLDLEHFKKYILELDEKEQLQLGPFIQELEEMLRNRTRLAQYWRKGTLYRLSLIRQIKNLNYFDYIRCLPMPIFAFLQSCYRKIKSSPHEKQ